MQLRPVIACPSPHDELWKNLGFDSQEQFAQATPSPFSTTVENQLNDIAFRLSDHGIMSTIVDRSADYGHNTWFIHITLPNTLTPQKRKAILDDMYVSNHRQALNGKVVTVIAEHHERTS